MNVYLVSTSYCYIVDNRKERWLYQFRNKGDGMEVYLVPNSNCYDKEGTKFNYSAGKDMDVYLAGINGRETMVNEGIEQYKPFILHSFFYANEYVPFLIKNSRKFMLDSGAFTFMVNSDAVVHWDEYVKKYIDYIKSNNPTYFFELDIDSIVGYDEVRRYRRMLKDELGRDPIPVWHKSRGIEDFKKSCNDYDYVAIGGIVAGEIKSAEYKNFIPMIKYAHDCGSKIHGLGFTSMKSLTKYHFDSVDSTAWTTGNKFGFAYKYRGGLNMDKIQIDGKRIKPKEVAINNFTEWCKFQIWAEKNL